MNKPAASVIIPTRGGAGRLPVLLAALAAQDTEDFEVVPVVDGDVDGSEDVLRRWSGQLPLKPVVLPQNRGRAAALNAGAEAAAGRVLVRCDDDLEPRANFISGHLARHAAEACGVVGLTTNAFPDTPYARAYGRKADARAIAAALALPAHRTWRLWSANVSVPASLHRQLRGYDGRYRRYGWEDVDFGYRLHRAGLPVVVAPELMAVHHGASTTTAARAVRALHSGAARETFVTVHGEAAIREFDGSRSRASRSLWDRLVRGASAVATERTLRAYGTLADVAVRALPAGVGEKLIALAVESAGTAGVRYPERARGSF
ncbi:glycosyltransferase family 2 protein [Sinomonas susongensis]|uniref:glycosyltransferase family 2 protein n=1 Tax=Sinomonas susongensis TaxID=1324851 RepID=UPI001108476A|nr:glycosyltransferase [Sinomonas susongensis]